MQPCVRSQKGALLCPPPPPLPLCFPHCPRCSGVPHATEHPGSLTCAACCSHAWAAKISMGTRFSGYSPWPLLWLLCLQAKETVTLKKKKTFFLSCFGRRLWILSPWNWRKLLDMKIEKEMMERWLDNYFYWDPCRLTAPPGTVWNHTLSRTCSSCT